MNWKLASCGVFMGLAACGGRSSPPPPPPPPEIDVRGDVVDAFNRPVQSATILITGYPLAITDNRGGFTISNVRVPYDLTVIDIDSDGRPMVFAYAGLTRQNPNLLASPRHLSSATISGRISGPSLEPSGAVVAFDSIDTIATSATVSPDGTFTLTRDNSVSWPGPGFTGGALHALQWQTSASGPLAYSYGRKVVPRLEPGASLSDQTIELHSVGSTELHGTVETSSLPIESITLYVSFDEDSLLPVWVDSSTRQSFSYRVPDIPDIACLILVRALSPGGVVTSRHWGHCGGDWTLTIAASVPELTDPADEFTGFRQDSELKWTNGFGLFEVEVSPENPNLARYILRTSQHDLRLPDLSAAGISFPASARYRWQVRTTYAGSTTDEFASGSGVYAALEEITSKPLVEPVLFPGLGIVRGESSIRHFTTQP